MVVSMEEDGYGKIAKVLISKKDIIQVAMYKEPSEKKTASLLRPVCR